MEITRLIWLIHQGLIVQRNSINMRFYCTTHQLLNNIIFLVIQYHQRFDNIVRDYFSLIQPIEDYVDKVVIMLSHSDRIKEKQKDKSIQNLFAKFIEADITPNFILYSEESNPYEISNLIYSCISNMKQESLKISKQDFYLKFKLFEPTTGIINQIKKFQIEVIRVYDEYKKLMLDNKSQYIQEVYVEFVNRLSVSLREDYDKLIQNLIKDNRLSINDNEVYTLMIQLQRKCINSYDNFIKNASSVVVLYDKNDIRSLIRRCPYCQTVWLKTQGCDGSTTCGNLPSPIDQKSTPKYVFQILREFGKLIVKRNQLPKPTAYQVASKGNKVGCGKNIIWGQLSCLLESEIKHLFEDIDVSIKKKSGTEKIQEIINSEGFTNSLGKIQKQVDTTFYS